MSSFFLELKTEEIPHTMLHTGAFEIKEKIEYILQEKEVEVAQEPFLGITPRRIVIFFPEIADKGKDRVEQITGPPYSVAFKDGQPTKAAIGFAKKVGVELDALKRVETEKGVYVAVEKYLPGLDTKTLLKNEVPTIIRGVSWPRNMYWGAKLGPWVRPIHSIISLWNDELLELEIFGVKSDRFTTGHPILSPQKIYVNGFKDYVSKLSELGIVVSFQERVERISSSASKLASSVDSTLVEDVDLLDKLASICEIPGVVMGSFDSTYLSLPKEVLVESLRVHQSAFVLEKGGVIQPFFITVMDRPDDPEGFVKSGNSWVVEARLEDAAFFYNEDRKVKLKDRIETLKGVEYHAKLGNLYDKTERLMQIVEALSIPEIMKKPLRDAVQLAKVDLTTEMVGEFPELQGKIGGIYAREEGYPELVWKAIYEQYKPISIDDSIPASESGKWLSLLDKIDHLVGFFSIGEEISGKSDPYALRRTAQGLLRIVIEGKIRVDIETLLNVSCSVYQEQGVLPSTDVQRIPIKVLSFLEDRLRYLAKSGRYGVFSHDEVEAVLDYLSKEGDTILERLEALEKLRSHERFRDLYLSVKRIKNIITPYLDNILSYKLNEELFGKYEKELWSKFKELCEIADIFFTDRYAKQLKERFSIHPHDTNPYYNSLVAFSELADPLEAFFSNVFVMVEDKKLRYNRLRLLYEISVKLDSILRIDKLVERRE